jgi:hypothetical protein
MVEVLVDRVLRRDEDGTYLCLVDGEQVWLPLDLTVGAENVKVPVPVHVAERLTLPPPRIRENRARHRVSR